MKYTFVGSHPETLASGRPLVFGDSVDRGELDGLDNRLEHLLVEVAPPASQPASPAPESEAK